MASKRAFAKMEKTPKFSVRYGLAGDVPGLTKSSW